MLVNVRTFSNRAKFQLKSQPATSLWIGMVRIVS